MDLRVMETREARWFGHLGLIDAGIILDSAKFSRSKSYSTTE
jgi:hypothetical protein